ncbi:hypothetical protein E2C01_049058 [Portunus trituberculatus]|uniref:Uncharacterized protein n=1 Tax=Portunus trituberculatus TaxID=210409 RepID=A0A5B7GD74_PORTR|nr:hypothetical protein [Portunus trituberculatus]
MANKKAGSYRENEGHIFIPNSCKQTQGDGQANKHSKNPPTLTDIRSKKKEKKNRRRVSDRRISAGSVAPQTFTCTNDPLKLFAHLQEHPQIFSVAALLESQQGRGNERQTSYRVGGSRCAVEPIQEAARTPLRRRGRGLQRAISFSR